MLIQRNQKNQVIITTRKGQLSEQPITVKDKSIHYKHTVQLDLLHLLILEFCHLNSKTRL